ncbi:MAG: C4-dicarboxylate ABC transporter, partial [Alphaproteobacteria bacterium]
MTEIPSTEAPVPDLRRSRGRTVLRQTLIALVVALVVLSLALGVVYLNRRAAARQVLTGWLDQRGIEAQVDVERFEIDGFVGSIRIGDPNDPDVIVDRVEVDYAVSAPWSSTGTGVSPSRIRLVRPVLRATWQDGALSLGSLDPLIEEFTGRPPRPDARAPVVIVESGRVRLNTEYGPLQLLGDARMEDGKLMRLKARLPAASLRSGDVEARSLGGIVDLTTTGDRVALILEASADAFSAGGGSGEGLRLSGRGDLPYPDLEQRSGDGRTVINLTLIGQKLSLGDAEARETETRLAFAGDTRGWIEAFRLRGQTSATMKAGQLSLPGLEARAASIAVPDAALTLSRGSA